MQSVQDFIDLEKKYNAHNCKPLDVVIYRAQGVWPLCQIAKVLMEA